MRNNQRRRKRLPSGLAGAYDTSDGHDPRFDPSPMAEAGLGRSGDRRKLKQLCSQVLRTLQLAWPTDHPALDATTPCNVLPAPNSHNLLVLIDCTQTPTEFPDSAILDSINSRSAMLREEVARAISRKATPRLAFAVLPRPVDPAVTPLK